MNFENQLTFLWKLCEKFVVLFFLTHSVDRLLHWLVIPVQQSQKVSVESFERWPVNQSKPAKCGWCDDRKLLRKKSVLLPATSTTLRLQRRSGTLSWRRQPMTRKFRPRRLSPIWPTAFRFVVVVGNISQYGDTLCGALLQWDIFFKLHYLGNYKYI